MNNIGRYLLYLVLLFAATQTAYWFYSNYEWVVEEINVGFQGKAKSNQLLAAEFFLRKMGINTRQIKTVTAFRELPAYHSTILIASQRQTLTTELSRELLGWANEGGHLVVEARYLPKISAATKSKDLPALTAELDDPLLDNLGIYTAQLKGNLMVPHKSLFNNSEIVVDFNHRRHLYFRDNHTEKAALMIANESGIYLAQFQAGQGLLTVLADSSVFSNKKIKDYDHARLLWLLTQQGGHDEIVWLMATDDMPALWKWLWAETYYLVISILLLLLLLLWKAPLRFGPRLNDATTERRSLLEHLRACGYYRWKNQQSGYLLTKVQESLWERIVHLHPIIQRADLQDAVAKLVEITAIEKEHIVKALTPMTEVNKRDFTENVYWLTKIRKKL